MSASANNFARASMSRSPQGHPQGDRHGHHFVDTADVYGERGGSETAMGQVLVTSARTLRAGDEVLHADGQRRRGRARRAATSCRRSRSALPQSRLRIAPSMSSTITIRDADRGNVRFLRPDPFGQGALCRLLQPCAACRRGAAHREGDLRSRPLLFRFRTEYSLVVRGIEEDLQPMARAYDMAFCLTFRSPADCSPASTRRARMPPARGSRWCRLPDRYVSDKNVGIVEQLEAFAAQRGRTMLELAFSWLASRAQVTERHRLRDPTRTGRNRR